MVGKMVVLSVDRSVPEKAETLVEMMAGKKAAKKVDGKADYLVELMADYLVGQMVE